MEFGGLSRAVSRNNPVLMVFEDAHWTDPTTAGIIASLFQGGKEA
jgi:predicted ATPase